jgi:hypothetical protein
VPEHVGRERVDDQMTNRGGVAIVPQMAGLQDRGDLVARFDVR